ncbi:MAG: SDR family NAD(P)-dependent oxidoreductase, partial [Cyanobacteria bacterium P01_F01_bin.153]
MSKTILLTGATDGIGLETAKLLVAQGHRVLLHGRNPAKLEKVAEDLAAQGTVESYTADLSDLAEVKTLAESVAAKHRHLDVLINNAGVFKTPTPITKDGLDIRFVV